MSDVTIPYGEYGGTVSLAVNGGCRVVGTARRATRSSSSFCRGGTCTMPVFDGLAQIQNGGLACGGGNELSLNNVNVSIDFGAELDWLSLHFGEWGGNVNLRINGACRNVANFAALDGVILGGVRVVVTDFGQPGQSCGCPMRSDRSARSGSAGRSS